MGEGRKQGVTGAQFAPKLIKALAVKSPIIYKVIHFWKPLPNPASAWLVVDGF